MKKLLIIISLFVGSLPVFAQTSGPGWKPQNTKLDQRDSSYFHKDANFNATLRVKEGSVQIGGITVSANGAELNILDGALVTPTELNYLVGATGKTGTGNLVFSNSPTITTTLTLPSGVAASTNDVHDTIQLERDNAVLGVAYEDYEGGSTGNDYYLTPDQVKGYIAAGGGGIFTEKMLSFRVGDTYAPDDGDSTVIHTEFTGKVLDIYRNGDYQTPRFTATNTRYGYRLDGDTVTVNPVFQAGEDWVINVKDPVSRNLIALEGAESTLLDSLAVYYKLDELSGTTGDDANDIQDAVLSSGTTATTDHAKFNYGRHIGYRGSIRSPYNASVNPTGEFTISMWIWADSIGTTNDYIFATSYSGTPAQPVQVYLDTDSKIVFRTYNTEGTRYGSISSGALSDSTLYHIVLVHRGNGYTNKIYVNGMDVTAEQGGVNYTFSGSLFQASGSLFYANYMTNGLLNFRGYIDECGLWHQAFTPADVTALYNSTTSHPFTE